jgi:NADH-quinone oxidoreductase subunit K
MTKRRWSSMGILDAKIGLEAVMILSAVLFCIGLYGILSKKSVIQILMSVEVMAIALTINVVAINRWVTPADMTGWFFALFEMALAAAELGLGLALVIALYRKARTAEVEDYDEMKG